MSGAYIPVKVETTLLHHYSNYISENHQLSDETLHQGWQGEDIWFTKRDPNNNTTPPS